VCRSEVNWFSSHHAHHQERQNCVNTTSGSCHSVSVAVVCRSEVNWFSSHRAYRQERQNCVNTTSGSCHSVSVAV
jgi:hypothetical protein